MQPAGQLSQDGKWLWNGQQWVPYQQPLTAVVAWALPYESSRSRCTAASVLLALNAAALALGVVFELVNVSYISQGSPSDGGLAIAVGVLAAVFLLGYYGTYIAAIVLFCMWLHRVVRNLPALGSVDPRWSPAGAVWRCFFPILNLVHPLYGTLEAWRASDAGRRWLDVGARRSIGAPGIFAAWWTLWLAGGWVSAIGGQLVHASGPGTQVVAAWFDIAGSLLVIGAAAFAIVVVRETTARQERKNALIQSGQLA